MNYNPQQKRLVAHFFGAKGLFAFDLRKGKKQQSYYDFHYYPMCDYDVGDGVMDGYAMTAGTTQHLQYDVIPINLNKTPEDHDSQYRIFPGHKAVITKLKIDNEFVITGAKNGEVKVMGFNVFKKDIQKGPNCMIING